MAVKEYKTRMKAYIDVNVLNAINMIKAEKNTDDNGSILKMLLLESPTFAQKYEEIKQIFGENFSSF